MNSYEMGYMGDENTVRWIWKVKPDDYLNLDDSEKQKFRDRELY